MNDLTEYLYYMKIAGWLNSNIVENKINYAPIIVESNNIICEHYLDKNKLSTLFNIIIQGASIQEFTGNDIANLLPRNLKITKKLRNSFNQLLVFNIPFTIDFISNSIPVIINKINTAAKVDSKQLTDEILNVFLDNTGNINENIAATFIHFKDIFNISVMFIDPFKDNVEDDFRHEFIHYYQWTTGDDIVNLNDEITLPANISLITKNNSLSLVKKIYNKAEIIPYINELIDQFFDYNMTKAELKTLWMIKRESAINYIIRMSKSNFFQYLHNTNQNITPFFIFICLNIFEPKFYHELTSLIYSKINK